MFIVFICFFYLHTTKIPNIPNPTHHHGHFPLNHPVNPRCILIKLSNISRNDPRHNKRITYKYIVSNIVSYTQNTILSSSNKKKTIIIILWKYLVFVRTHTHTHLRCLAIDINRIIERSINQSCNLLCFICVSCCCFAFIEQKTQTNQTNTYQNTIKCWLLFPVNNR